MQLTDTTTNAA